MTIKLSKETIKSTLISLDFPKEVTVDLHPYLADCYDPDTGDSFSELVFCVDIANKDEDGYGTSWTFNLHENCFDSVEEFKENVISSLIHLSAEECWGDDEETDSKERPF